MSKPATTQDQADQIEALKTSMNTMDVLAHDVLTRIASIARLALFSMETPDFYRHVEHVARALEAIKDMADSTQDLIGHEAELHGCGYTDDGYMRRIRAFFENQRNQGGRA